MLTEVASEINLNFYPPLSLCVSVNMLTCSLTRRLPAHCRILCCLSSVACVILLPIFSCFFDGAVSVCSAGSRTDFSVVVCEWGDFSTCSLLCAPETSQAFHLEFYSQCCTLGTYNSIML